MLNKEGRAATAVECVLSDNCLEGCVLPSRRHRIYSAVCRSGVGWVELTEGAPMVSDSLAGTSHQFVY